MPPVGEFKCPACSLALPIGRMLYVVDGAGVRIKAPHPLESGIIFNAFGRQPTPEEARSRTGWIAFCLCRQCFSTTELDVDRDQVQCGKCGGRDLVEGENLEGKPCPRCSQGTIARQVVAWI